eukprot:scaffold29456_cov59-Attheya_sp.AAC.4
MPSRDTLRPLAIMVVTLAIPVRLSHPDQFWKALATLVPYVHFVSVFCRPYNHLIKREEPFCPFQREKKRDIYIETPCHSGSNVFAVPVRLSHQLQTSFEKPVRP